MQNSCITMMPLSLPTLFNGYLPQRQTASPPSIPSRRPLAIPGENTFRSLTGHGLPEAATQPPLAAGPHILRFRSLTGLFLRCLRLTASPSPCIKEEGNPPPSLPHPSESPIPNHPLCEILRPIEAKPKEPSPHPLKVCGFSILLRCLV